MPVLALSSCADSGRRIVRYVRRWQCHAVEPRQGRFACWTIAGPSCKVLGGDVVSGFPVGAPETAGENAPVMVAVATKVQTQCIIVTIHC